MKRLMILMIFLLLGLTIKTNAEPGLVHGGFEYFYESLSPYGSWIQIDGGVNVWRPYNLRAGWIPYKYGRWIWTNDGWYWDSDEPFGYIVFHYGRWYYDDYYGWIWVPDDVWAPAWVEWRYDNDYIGWAPLPPYASFSINFGIRFTTGYVTPYRYWHFVKYRYMCDPYVYKYYAPEHYKYRIYSGTRYRTNYGYSDGRVINRGVDVDYIRRRSGARIVERNVERVNNSRDFNNRGDRNNGPVRAYIINRDNFRDNGDRSYEVKRGTRPSTLDFNRVDIGRTDANRNDSRDNTTRIIDRNNDRNTPARVEPGRPDDRKINNVKPAPRNNREMNIDRTPRNKTEIQRQPRNENRNVRPEIKRENTERRAAENKREVRDNRNERRDSNSNRRK